MERFIDLRRELHKIPEIGFQEFKTQKFILGYLKSLPATNLEIKTWKTGILVFIKGTDPKETIAYRTDMDGLPLTEQTNYDFKSEHQGYMHACGHDMHMAIALGILTEFVENPIKNNILIIFQPAEEGPGGAKPMLESEEFKSWYPDKIFALHINPQYPVGTIAIKKGLLFANTSELYIDLYGESGHGAMPHLANDMVLAASQLVVQLQSIVSRNIDPYSPAVLTIGQLNSGTRQNIIAEKAELKGTIRTLDKKLMKETQNRIIQILDGVSIGFNCKYELNWGFEYNSVINDNNLTEKFIEWINSNTNYKIIECNPTMGGEDFGFFLEKIPGFMFWLGVDTPYSLHHPKIEPNEHSIEIAINAMTKFIQAI